VKEVRLQNDLDYDGWGIKVYSDVSVAMSPPASSIKGKQPPAHCLSIGIYSGTVGGI